MYGLNSARSGRPGTESLNCWEVIITIKPIETYYNGYRFRSRLEARWAVFFDTGNVKYEYEPEGFELESGLKWLPDFYLPDFDCYVEVKPDTDDGVNEILEKVKPFIQWGSKVKRVLILSNIPGEIENDGIWHFPYLCWVDGFVESGWFFFFAYGDYNEKTYEYDNLRLEGKRSKGKSFCRYVPWDYRSYKRQDRISILPKSDSDASMYFSNDDWEKAALIYETDPEILRLVRKYNRTRNKLVFDAIRAARQARFEYGEQYAGNVKLHQTESKHD